MKNGLFEKILNKRYGKPTISEKGYLIEKIWGKENDDVASVLYVDMKDYGVTCSCISWLKYLYGDSIGGFLIGNSLKIASLSAKPIFGLYTIYELQKQPEVQKALSIDQNVDFFMDASNVWYYGLKSGELFVYDTETFELDPLGPVEMALETLIDEWESVIEKH